jgi:fibronectin-binding autotransporter adhesin
MKRILLALALVCSNAWAQNFGFETGNLSGWTSSSGDVVVTTGLQNYSPGGGKTWTINPFGSYMAQLYPGGATQFNTATTQLGLTSAENTAIRDYLTYQSQNGGGGDPTPTTASWIKREVTLQAGSTYTFAWNYLSTDYTPYNDGSMMTLTHATNASVTPTLNNSQQRYALLGFTNPGTGNYATGSYGSTGWQLATFTVPETGTYVLGFTTFNLGDTALSPMLFIDEIQGTTTLNGETFGPIAPNAGSTAPVTSSEPPPPPPPEFCCGGSSATFTPNPVNTSKVTNFVNRTIQDSQVYIEQIGDVNTVVVQQTGTRNNYAEYNGNGNNNIVNVTQSGNASTTANYTELNINGNSNAVNLTQNSTGGSKGIFATVNNSNNSLTVLQKDAGSHYAEVLLNGGNKTVDVTQQGSAGHQARIELSGAPVGLTLTQSGSTQQNYSINYNCATAGGCGPITVTQGQ